MRNDHTEPMTAQDWLAWREMTGYIVHRREWKALREMDKAYVIAMRKERSDMNARLADKDNGHRRNRF